MTTKNKRKAQDDNLPTSVALFRDGKKIYLLMTDDSPHQIQGWSTLEKAKAYFTGGYNAAHSRSYEASMSACINFIQFQPRVITFKNIDDLKESLIDDTMALVRLHAVSGHYTAITCKKDAYKVYDTRAVTPELISDQR